MTKGFIGILNTFFPRTGVGVEEYSFDTPPIEYYNGHSLFNLCRCGYFCRHQKCCICRREAAFWICDICKERVGP